MPRYHPNPEARRYYMRKRVLELGSYKAAAAAEGVNVKTVERWAGTGLTSGPQGRKRKEADV